MGDGKYLSPDADRSKRNKYRLHSVLVHSGGTHGGHYYAYSRPDGVNWLKFEDEQVRRIPSVPAAAVRQRLLCCQGCISSNWSGI